MEEIGYHRRKAMEIVMQTSNGHVLDLRDPELQTMPAINELCDHVRNDRRVVIAAERTNVEIVSRMVPCFIKHGQAFCKYESAFVLEFDASVSTDDVLLQYVRELRAHADAVEAIVNGG